MHRLLILGSILFFLLFSNSDAQAESPRKLVKRGNRAYAEEKYDDALSSYEEALKEAPDSPHVFFNKGTAHYKKGEFDNAADAFEKSADRAEDKNLEAEARFNQGNALIKKAKSLMPSDLSGALENCKKSIQDYREALELEPDFAEAAENIETARLTVKSILDQMEKQKEQSKEDQGEDQNKDQDKDQGQNQDQNQDSEKKKHGESDGPENEEGESENQESSEEGQSGSNENKNEDTPERGKPEKEPNDISDMMKADAESILDEEKENKERRRAKGKGRFTDVDRDW